MGFQQGQQVDYEVSKSGTNGFAIASDCKYAWLFYVGSSQGALEPDRVASKDQIGGCADLDM